MTETTEPVVAPIVDALVVGFDLVADTMSIFMDPPAIYFVGFAMIAAAAKVTRKFVPMKRG